MHGQLSEQKSGEKVDFLDIVTTDTPYALPSNWEWVRIESIITKDVGGGTPSKSVDEYWKNGTIPWMSVKDFSSAKNGVLEDTIDHITQAGLDNSSSNLIDTDAIIICMRMSLGKIVRLKRPMAINQDLRAIWVNPCVDSNYFVFYYSTLKVEGHGMTVAGINKKQLMAYMMPLPPINEQYRIVERINRAFTVLDTIDAIQARYVDNLTILKRKLISVAITGKLTEQLSEDGTAEELFQQIQTEKQALIKSGKIKKEKPLVEITETEKPFEIPENWKWVSIGDVCVNIQYGSSKKSSPSGKMPVIRMGNIQMGKIVFDKLVYTSDDDEIAKYPLEPGDLLFNRTNSMELVGKTGIYKGEQPAIYAGYLVRVTPLLLLPDYLNYCMQSKYYWDYCRTVRIDSNGQSNINAEKLKRFVFPLPPLAEQRRIVSLLEQVLERIAS